MNLKTGVACWAIAISVLGIHSGMGQTPQHWGDLYTEAAHRAVNIVIIGDSIACCIGPKDYNNVWPNQLRAQLELKAPSHGSGIIPVGNNNGVSMNPQWSFDGAKDEITTIEFGPFQSGTGQFGGVFRLEGSHRLTISPHRGDHANIYFATTNDSAGGIRVSSGATFLGLIGREQSMKPEARMASIALPADGADHSITLEPAQPTSAIYIYGVEFTSGSVGLSIHNLAHGYARSEAWGGDPVRQMAFLSHIPGKLDAAIIALGVNDSVNNMGTTAAQYTANMRAIIGALRRLNPKIRIVIQDEINTKPGEVANLLPQSSVRQQEIRLASELHLGYISIADRWGPEKQAELDGYMASDGVHPSDSGGQAIAVLMEHFIQ